MSDPSLMKSVPLVIGVGNPDRGDDAIGPSVADAVRRLYGDVTEQLVMDGDLSNLAVTWRSDQEVVIIDAMVTGRPPGTVLQIDPLTPGGTALRSTGMVSSHGFGVNEAIELARLLNRLPRRLTVVGVEAGTFDLFAPLSDPVAAAVDDVVARISELLGLDLAELSAAEHD